MIGRVVPLILLHYEANAIQEHEFLLAFSCKCRYFCPTCHAKHWAELLRPHLRAASSRRIFEVDPLACPRCGEQMRIVAFVTEPRIIDRILDHLRRTAPTRPRPRAPPRRWKSSATTASA
jgi:hypothetical protein